MWELSKFNMKMKNDQGVGWCLIPPEIVSRGDLSPNEKLIVGRINGLCSIRGYCFASNNWLSHQFGLSPGTMSNIVSSLVRKNLLSREVVRNKEGRIVQRRLYTKSIKKWIRINPLVEGSNREDSIRDNVNNGFSKKKSKKGIDTIENHLRKNPSESENINQAIEYYIQMYEEAIGKYHPPITEIQFEVVKDGFLNPMLSDLHNLDIESYKKVIDDWFSDINAKTDYNINHFVSGEIIMQHAVRANVVPREEVFF